MPTAAASAQPNCSVDPTLIPTSSLDSRFDDTARKASPMLGAAHAVELPFVFSQLHDTRLAPLFGPEPPQQVADAMSNAWATFARDGIPSIASLDSWPHLPGNGSRPVVRFDVETTLDDNPLAASLAYWLRGANG